MKSNDLNILKLLVFRENMNASLTKGDAERIFGKGCVEKAGRNISRLIKDKENGEIWERKLRKAKEEFKFFLIFDLVTHISVSGSVAAQNAKEDHDIDLFIVVRKNSAWIYRLLLQIKNIFARKIRVGMGGEVADMYCVNLICEQDSLKFDSDIFTFHELMYMKPIYNSDFYDTILSQNGWIYRYGYTKTLDLNVRESEKKNFVVGLLDILAMFFQILYMIFSLHKPNIKRILRNYMNGRIVFHPEGFKSDKEKAFSETFSKRVKQFEN